MTKTQARELADKAVQMERELTACELIGKAVRLVGAKSARRFLNLYAAQNPEFRRTQGERKP
jgi:hypothetical protein